MKSVKTKILKGFRDFLPEKANQREYLVDILKQVFKSFGFEPLQTPALEYTTTLLGKYGEEADKLIYQFQDRGGRQIGLRYDLTVPLARVIACNPQLTFPFKRYQIQEVWRAEKPQQGRYREFLQCDIDIVGAKGISAEAEIVSCVLAVLKKIQIPQAKMIINDRKIFKNLDYKFIVSLDKIEKIGEEEVIKEMAKKGMTLDEAKKTLRSLKNTPLPSSLKTLFTCLKTAGFKENQDFVFDPFLARGLDYYTGVIFELTSSEYKGGSLGGGGRYDNLIGSFLPVQKENLSAVGFSFGIDRIIDFMNQLNLFPPSLSSAVSALVTIFKPELLKESLKVASWLRKSNFRVEVYPQETDSLNKQLKYADKKGIPYVILIGPDEVKSKTLTLKEMKTGKQKTLSFKQTADFLKQSRI